jgi:uncharacterized protein (UPF0335 family)
MDKATATAFIELIERHRAEEAAIWDDMRNRDDYESNEDKTIKSILDARRKGREMLEEADADLGAFDWVDDGTGNYVPRAELAEKAPA